MEIYPEYFPLVPRDSEPEPANYAKPKAQQAHLLALRARERKGNAMSTMEYKEQEGIKELAKKAAEAWEAAAQAWEHVADTYGGQ